MAEFFKYRRGDNFSPECGEGVLSNLKIIPYSGSGEYGDYIPFDTFPATPSQRYIKIFILYFAPTSLTHLKWFSGSKLFAEITVGVAEGETLSVNYNHEVTLDTRTRADRWWWWGPAAPCARPTWSSSARPCPPPGCWAASAGQSSWCDPATALVDTDVDK